LHRDPEVRICKDAKIIVEADERPPPRPRQVDVEQARVERIDDWKDRNREQHDEHRHDEHGGAALVITKAPAKPIERRIGHGRHGLGLASLRVCHHGTAP
jgi:hypothetical protein